MAESSVDMLTNLQKRCDAIKQKKMSAQASLDALQKQYGELEEEAKVLGIESVDDIPAALEHAQGELDTLTADVEKQISATEAQIKMLG
jgi:peptidoglycan hydrolase CwlO-like protein